MFITFEGGEGSGKTTQIERLRDYFNSLGKEVILTREPGSTRIGRDIRKILLHVDNVDLKPKAELLLYLADRAQHFSELIIPSLEAGKVVISDRCYDSTVAYQSYGRGMDKGELDALNDYVMSGVTPDLTFYLDVDPVEGIRRATRRNGDDDITEAEGRFEAEHMSFHMKVRQGYLDIANAEPWRMKIIDANDGIDAVTESIMRHLSRINI